MSSPTKPVMNETRTAMQELLSELDQTRREYARLSLQLTQQDALVQHLKDAEAKKDQVIAFLQEELARMNEMYGQESEVQGEEAKTKILELEHRNKYLEVEITRLTEENQVFASFEKENRQLREALIQHQAAIEKLQAINEDLKSRTSTEMTDFRGQLEAEFKRRLSEAEKKFRAEAYRALSEEAKIALQGNDHLQLVLQRQNDSIEGVLARCKQLETSHERMKTEQELAHQNIKQHQNEVQRLRKQLSDSKAKNTQLEEALKQRRVERASLELLYMEYEATRKELTRSQAQTRKVQRESERWKARAVKLNTDNGLTGFEQAEEMAKQQERVDDQLRKEKARREKRQKMREKRLQMAAAGADGGMTTDHTSSEYDASDKDHEEVAARVNPMEILAMWNINFDAWQEDNLPQADRTTNTIQYPSYEGDAEAADGDPQEHRPAPPRKKTHTETTTEARLKADRGLSVLSRHKSKLPNARFPKPRQREVSSSFPDNLTIINSEGEFAVRSKKVDKPGGGNRFFVP